MILHRQEYLSTGIFGTLSSEFSDLVLMTLEHAYQTTQAPLEYYPKLVAGVYTCTRGMHRLSGMANYFETFEVTNVPGHTGILFHRGNTNNDSAGCILLGMSRYEEMGILSSRMAFEKFMTFFKDINNFELTVIDG